MKLYRESYIIKDEKCSLGCKHHVTYNEVIDVEEVGSEAIEVFYGDISCGTGYKRWYADSKGTIYYRETTWDGPGSYLQADDYSGEFWGIRPHGFEVNKDLDGNLMDRSGEYLGF